MVDKIRQPIPKELTKTAKTRWTQYRELRAGLTPIQLIDLAQLLNTLVVIEELYRRIEKVVDSGEDSYLMQNTNGSTSIHPLRTQLKQHEAERRKLMATLRLNKDALDDMKSDDDDEDDQVDL